MSDSPNFDNIAHRLTDEERARIEVKSVEIRQNIEDDYRPGIDPKVRTVAYFTLGISAPLVGLITGATAIWFPDYAGNVAATGVVVLSFIGSVAGVFGIVYRPTK